MVSEGLSIGTKKNALEAVGRHESAVGSWDGPYDLARFVNVTSLSEGPPTEHPDCDTDHR